MSETNYERIKNMTVEEMAEYFAKRHQCVGTICKLYDGDGYCQGKCYEGIKQWLEQEAE